MCDVRRREEEEKEPGIQNQKQEPHTKLWGKTTKTSHIKVRIKRIQFFQQSRLCTRTPPKKKTSFDPCAVCFNIHYVSIHGSFFCMACVGLLRLAISLKFINVFHSLHYAAKNLEISVVFLAIIFQRKRGRRLAWCNISILIIIASLIGTTLLNGEIGQLHCVS